MPDSRKPKSYRLYPSQGNPLKGCRTIEDYMARQEAWRQAAVASAVINDANEQLAAIMACQKTWEKEQ